MSAAARFACFLLSSGAVAQPPAAAPETPLLRLERTGFHPRGEDVFALTWSADGRFVAGAGRTGARVLDRTGWSIALFHGVLAFAPGPTGPELWIADSAGVRRWNAATQSDVGERVHYPTGFSPQFDLWLSAFGRVSFAAVASAPLAALEPGQRFVLGEELAVVDREGAAVRLAAPREPELSMFLSEPELAWHEGRGLLAVLRASPPGTGGDALLTRRWFGVIEVYDRKLECIQIERLGQGGTSIAFDAAGDRLALTSLEGEIALFDARTWQRIDSALADDPLQAPPLWVAFVDDRMLIAHDGLRITLWHATPLRRVAEICGAAPGPPNVDTITAEALSPDRTHLAVARGREVTIARVVRQ